MILFGAEVWLAVFSVVWTFNLWTFALLKSRGFEYDVLKPFAKANRPEEDGGRPIPTEALYWSFDFDISSGSRKMI